MDSFNGLPSLAQRRLSIAIEEVGRSAAPQVEMRRLERRHLQSNGHDWIVLHEEIKELGKKRPALYVFRLADDRDRERVRAALCGATVPGKARDNKRLSSVLYVGTSRSLHTRFREHLGFCSEKTYSLKLFHWLPDAVSLDFTFAFYEPDTSLVALAALEEALWEELQPMFGRKGAR